MKTSKSRQCSTVRVGAHASRHQRSSVFGLDCGIALNKSMDCEILWVKISLWMKGTSGFMLIPYIILHPWQKGPPKWCKRSTPDAELAGCPKLYVEILIISTKWLASLSDSARRCMRLSWQTELRKVGRCISYKNWLPRCLISQLCM